MLEKENIEFYQLNDIFNVCFWYFAGILFGFVMKMFVFAALEH